MTNTTAKPTFKTFNVTMRAECPGFGETSEVRSVYARTAADAISSCRKSVKRNGWTRQDGTMHYSAKVAA